METEIERLNKMRERIIEKGEKVRNNPVPKQEPKQEPNRNRDLAARTTPAATPAKTLPSKPAVPTGTTAGGTTFQRRAATGAELRAAQAARAAAATMAAKTSDLFIFKD